MIGRQHQNKHFVTTATPIKVDSLALKLLTSPEEVQHNTRKHHHVNSKYTVVALAA
jgi:hypothetical protein